VVVAGRGGWAQLSTGGVLTSDAFVVDADAQSVAFDLGYLSPAAIDRVHVDVLSGPHFQTATRIASPYCTSCGLRWAGSRPMPARSAG
jgi:hypothetical protein